jgi:predicted  nucleic acid-binding Zn-ribbon protein
MSGQGYEELIVLNRKLDELVDRYKTLKTELSDIRRQNETLKSAVREKEEQLREFEIKYERIKISGALLSGGDNALEAKKKITELVREIDRCVALLNR